MGAPFGPGAVVDAGVRVFEQAAERIPGLAGAVSDRAVGDDAVFGRDAVLAKKPAHLLGVHEPSLRIAESLDRKVDAARDMSGLPGALGCAGGPETFAVVLGAGADVEEHSVGLPEQREHGLSREVEVRVGRGELIDGRCVGGLLDAPLAPGLHPLLAWSIHQADVIVAVAFQQPEAEMSAIAVEDRGSLAGESGSREQPFESGSANRGVV